jgi:hypothetical protein
MSGESLSSQSVNVIPDLEPEIGDKNDDDDDCRIPSSLIVRNVPIEVFQDEDVKTEFTNYITQYAVPKNTIFLKSFRRVRFDFASPNEAYHVRTRLSMFEFHGDILHVYFIQPETATQSDRVTTTSNNRNPSATSLASHLSHTSGDESDSRLSDHSEMQAPANSNAQAPFGSSQTDVPTRQTVILEPEKLYPPQPERVYLISPPSSPPLHWQQVRETKPKPGIEMEILSKLAELKPGDTVELIPPQPKLNAPQICVHVCDESNLNSNNDVPRCTKGKIIQTRRPPIR